MRNKENAYWFPARRYGWGWGLPSTWQGWCAFAALFVLLAFGMFVWPTFNHSDAFELWAVASTAAFVAVCIWKGEPPKWHWGD